MRQSQRYIYMHLVCTQTYTYMNSINIFEHLLYHGNVTVKELIVSFQSILQWGICVKKKKSLKQYTLKIIKEGVGKGIHEMYIYPGARPCHSSCSSPLVTPVLTHKSYKQFTFSKQLSFCLKNIYFFPSYLHADCFLYLRCPSF